MIKRFIIKLCLNILWQLSDDAGMTFKKMGEEYHGCPDDLKDETFHEYYFYTNFSSEECVDWLTEGEDDEYFIR